jgi:hypothetical protein
MVPTPTRGTALRVLAAVAALSLVVAEPARADTPPDADCASYEPVRKRLAEMTEQVAMGASEEELESPDLVGPLRACFQTQVMPQLTRAESNEKLVSRATSDYFVWARQPVLLGLDAEFTGEFAQAATSIEKGVSHAYGVARDRCIKLGDHTQIPVMLGYMRFAQLLGFTITSALDSDLEACLRGSAYLVEATLQTESRKEGVTSRYRYTAMLRRAPDDDGSELSGTGTYSGFLMASPANCELRKTVAPQRLTVEGRLVASGGVMDMAAPGAKPDPHLAYTLETRDWPFLPLPGRDPYARTAEDKEAVKGSGSIFTMPIQLTGRVTTSSDSTTTEASCDDVVTRRTDVRIVRLQGKLR